MDNDLASRVTHEDRRSVVRAVFDDPVLMDHIASYCVSPFDTARASVSNLAALRRVCKDRRVAVVLRRRAADAAVRYARLAEVDLKLAELGALCRCGRRGERAITERVNRAIGALRTNALLLPNEGTGGRDALVASLVELVTTCPDFGQIVAELLRETLAGTASAVVA